MQEMTAKFTKLSVTYRGTPLTPATINRRMDAADPGHWGLDHSLAWSCPVMAQHAADLARFTFGPRYDVLLTPTDRMGA